MEEQEAIEQQEQVISNVSDDVGYLEERVKRLELQLRYSELQKKWEMSKVRLLILSATTYVVIAFFMYLFEIEDPLVNAIIPGSAYILSTISVPFIRKVWVRSYIASESKHTNGKNT